MDFVGGYLMGVDQLPLLAASAETLPMTRIYLAFISPAMVYESGSETFENTGLDQFDFATTKQAIADLKAGGVDTFLSMGGWNFNCFPYAYTRYSVGGYGTSTPNYWKVNEYANGNLDNCDESNQYCWTCEPESEGTDLATSFTIFPTPTNSSTWAATAAYIEAGAKSETPEWIEDLRPGNVWTDSSTGISAQIGGSDLYHTTGRNPYDDFVDLASDLGVAGIDLDYEEMWYADLTKVQSTTDSNGPWTLWQATYKYAAISKALMTAIETKDSSLMLSTASAAVGAWSGKWWGGNLKGLWLNVKTEFPEIISFMTEGANAGGINVMTYDLSNDNTFYECPETSVCSLSEQVAYYMDTYVQAGIKASVGYEIGQPAYPDPTHYAEHQLPLTKSELQKLSSTQAGINGFFWEMYKQAVTADEATTTEVSQFACKSVFGDDEPRCSGTIPGGQESTDDDDWATDDGSGSDDGSNCKAQYDQCGGDGYTGSTKCCSGLTCTGSEWWMSCQ
jgi:hypothetical protein